MFSLLCFNTFDTRPYLFYYDTDKVDTWCITITKPCCAFNNRIEGNKDCLKPLQTSSNYAKICFQNAC